MNRASIGRERLQGEASRRAVALPWSAVGRLGVLVAALAGDLAIAAPEYLQVVAGKEQRIFSGSTQAVCVLFHNPGVIPFDQRVRMRIFQTSSTTAALLAEKHWKRLRVLPNQTVVEFARVNLPAVKAPTRFLIQWGHDPGRVIGTTEIRAYPTNLLARLRPMLGCGELGVLDPSNQIKPLLQAAGVRLMDLAECRLDEFHGSLAIIGPLESRSATPSGLVGRIKNLAGNGVPVVWIVPGPWPCDNLRPWLESVPVGHGVVRVVRSNAIADLADKPVSQLRLLACCRLALRPEPPRLSDWTACFNN